MTTRELTIAALTALATAGGVYVLDKSGTRERVVLVADTSGEVELKGSAATEFLVDDAGRPRSLAGSVSCKAGGNLDGVWRDDKEWCSDGNGATWVRDAKGEETIEIVDGKVYSTKVEAVK